MSLGQAMSANTRNKAAIREYKWKDQMRVAKTMRDDILYSNKKVKYKELTQLANLAAQKAYTKSQISLNKAFSEIMLKNQDSFREMLKNEGELEGKFADRGTRGKSMARALLLNKASLGIKMRQRARSLTEAQYALKSADESTELRRQEIVNSAFSKVALQPVRDIPEPPPVLENPNMIFAIGAAGALAGEFGKDGIFNKGDGGLKSNNFSFNQDLNLGSFDYGEYIDVSNTFSSSFDLGITP